MTPVEILTAAGLFILGVVMLIFGGNWFVDGSIGIARRMKMPEVLIGATVVSIGTTLPEVMVSASAAVSGHGEIAYGNAIGSILCNTGLIAAVTMAFRPYPVEKGIIDLPPRSTLSDANSRRDEGIFGKIYMDLYQTHKDRLSSDSPSPR